MQQNSFNPHLESWVDSLLLFGSGIIIFFISSLLLLPIPGLFLCGAFWFFSWRKFQQWKSRKFGLRFEAAAIKNLSDNLPTNWRMRTDVLIPRIGNVDALVSSHDFRVTVEIKSYMGIRLSGGRLVKMNGETLKRDPIQQCLDQKWATMSNRAVLWMPQAKQHNTFIHEGVIVVNGPVFCLIDALQIHAARV